MPIFDERVRARPEIVEALEVLHAKRAGIVGPFPELDIRGRYLVAPVRSRDESCGYLVLDERGTRFGTLDMLIARQAAQTVALEMTAEQRAASEEWDAGEILLSELVRGNRDVASLRRRVPRTPGSTSTRRTCSCSSPVARVTSIRCRPRATPRTSSPAGWKTREPTLATGVTEGITLLVAIGADRPARAAVAEVVEAMEVWCADVAPGGALTVAVSAALSGAGGLRARLRRGARARGGLRRHHRPRRHVVAAIDCLGAARLLVLNDADTTLRFVSDTLGPLLHPVRAPGRHRICSTHSRRSSPVGATSAPARATCTSTRTRFATGWGGCRRCWAIDVVNDSEAQLTVQLAITVHGIAGST